MKLEGLRRRPVAEDVRPRPAALRSRGGFLPQFFPREHISWESHLMGLLAGAILAVYYRKTGPQRIKYDWEDDEDDDTEPGDSSPDDPDHSMDNTGNAEITYHYKKDP